MKRILVIDDDNLIRNMMKRIIEKENIEVVIAADGNIGVEEFKKQPFDMVITDIIMPGKEGLETIREIKQINPEISVLAMSGGGRIHPDDYLKTASILGADRCIKKPFDTDELISVVRELIGY